MRATVGLGGPSTRECLHGTTFVALAMGHCPSWKALENESPNVDSRDIQIPEFTAGIWFDDTAVDIRDRAQKHIFCAVGKCGHQLRRQVLVDRLGELGVGSDLVVERPQHFRNRTLLCEGRNLNK